MTLAELLYVLRMYEAADLVGIDDPECDCEKCEATRALRSALADFE